MAGVADIYEADGGEAVQTTWCVRRTQNQHHNIRVSQLLNAVNLGLELLRWTR